MFPEVSVHVEDSVRIRAFWQYPRRVQVEVGSAEIVAAWKGARRVRLTRVLITVAVGIDTVARDRVVRVSIRIREPFLPAAGAAPLGFGA